MPGRIGGAKELAEQSGKGDAPSSVVRVQGTLTTSALVL